MERILETCIGPDFRGTTQFFPTQMKTIIAVIAIIIGKRRAFTYTVRTMRQTLLKISIQINSINSYKHLRFIYRKGN